MTDQPTDPRIRIAAYRASCPRCDWTSASEYHDPLKALACADAHIRAQHPRPEAEVEPLSITAAAIAAIDAATE